MMVETAAEDARLRAVVSEASVRSLAEHWDDPELGAAQKPFSPLAAQTSPEAVLANQGPPPSLMGLVGDISPRSLLLIRGLDGQAEEVLNRSFHAAAGRPKSLWEVPGAGRTAALSALKASPIPQPSVTHSGQGNQESEVAPMISHTPQTRPARELSSTKTLPRATAAVRR